MLKELFARSKESLDLFFKEVSHTQAEALLQELAACKGTLIFTGVGKSGLVAKKVAVTMTSCGTRALFLSPTDALHGDLGIATRGDTLIVFSKSGESDELLALIPPLRNKGTKIISIVNNADSRLAKASDFVMILPVQKELCPYDMAPTSSTVAQMILGDILTIALMQMKNVTLDEYAGNHPAGRIGKRITMRVHDLMIKNDALPVCQPLAKLVDTLVNLSAKKCGCVLVTDPSAQLLGIFTDGDLRRSLQALGAKALDTPIQELMSKNPRTINSQELVLNALKLMESDQKNAISVLPVVDGGRVVGLLKLHDIIQSGI